MQIEQQWPAVSNLHWGNAGTFNTGGRHWIVGFTDALKASPLHFMPDDAEASSLAVKWRAHPQNDSEGLNKPVSTGRTISILGNEGGQFRLRFWTDNRDHATVLLLNSPGDFVIWGEGLNHEWEVPAQSTIVTIRWKPTDWTARLKSRYEFVTAQLRYTNDKILDAFKDWVKLFALIVGGYLWFRIEKQSAAAELSELPTLTRTLIGLAGVSFALMICSGARSWFNYRKAEHKIMPEAPSPQWHRSLSQEILMITVIVVLTGLAMYFIR